MHVNPKRIASADIAVGAEHGGHRPRIVRIPAKGCECSLGVRKGLDIVVPAEALREIAHQQLTDPPVVMNDAQQGVEALRSRHASACSSFRPSSETSRIRPGQPTNNAPL